MQKAGGTYRLLFFFFIRFVSASVSVPSPSISAAGIRSAEVPLRIARRACSASRTVTAPSPFASPSTVSIDDQVSVCADARDASKVISYTSLSGAAPVSANGRAEALFAIFVTLTVLPSSAALATGFVPCTRIV